MNHLSDRILIIVLPLLLYAGYEIFRLERKLDEVRPNPTENVQNLDDQRKTSRSESDSNPSLIEQLKTLEGERPPLEKRQKTLHQDLAEVNEGQDLSSSAGGEQVRLTQVNRLQTALNLVDRFAFDELDDDEFVKRFDAVLSELDRGELEMVITAYTEYLEAGSLRSDPLFGVIKK